MSASSLLSLLLLALVLRGVRSMSVADFGGNGGELEKKSKFIFTLVKFPNVMCGSGLDSGTCVTNTECTAREGTVVGSCAKGYGVCCKVTLTGCGGTVTRNNTLVLSTDYPSYYNEAKTCEYKVQFDDASGNICQIRYQHISNELVGPSSLGVCNNDKLVFKEDQKSTYFCGTAPSDYHWLVETSGTASPHTFTITTDTTSSNRRYAILVSWIPCSVRIPGMCGMYFTGTSGTVSSYNFGNNYYLAGLKYSVCFRKDRGYCTYSLMKTTNEMFIGGNVDNFRLPMGKGITLSVYPPLSAASAFCTSNTVQTMYAMSEICEFPTIMTSDQSQGPFYFSIVTKIDTVQNYNTIINAPSRAGYGFNWRQNEC
ncbi:uncharacterized protein LOC125027533 [Penaeus chinensis]|uniref:uncharacterized protein LOC125027533 n=1 Tax=Penaeus chinensis TaxID=139456 RepID=UPI001FB636DF|nr:uncharacterized protein LOC125027533 [Penaeus chinensis]